MAGEILKNLIWAWRFRLQEIGWQGWLGLGLFFGASMIAATVLLPNLRELSRLEHEVKQLRLQPVRQQAQTVNSSSTATPLAALAAFYRTLPQESQAGSEVARIFEVAEANALLLDRAEYTWIRDRDIALSRYQVVLPLRGEYTDIRLFMIDLLNQMPAVAINELAFRRESTGTAGVEARLRLTIYLGRKA